MVQAAVQGFELLAELALDLRWAWNHAADRLWRRLNPELWASTHNAWVVLQSASRDQLERLLSDPSSRKTVDDLVRARRDAAVAPAWFQRTHPQAPLSCVAYFSMEYMLSEALPIYSGGLGNVAGDQMKAASDLGVPMVGVGLLYSQGYFRQLIDRDGRQQALYPYNDPGQLPITPLRAPTGELLRLEIALPGGALWLRAWEAQVGRLKLYLLDSNDAANDPTHRGITGELYGGGPELRLKQELLLGIGGWRLLTALGIDPQVCHLNEGHAGFVVLERAYDCMRANARTFEEALAITRAGNLFTTHTAVAAGFDCFAPALIEQYLGRYAAQKLGLAVEELLALGRRNPLDPKEDFNMAYLAIRGSGAVNGVSRLHGQVSRGLFGALFPRWPVDEVPVGHVTNGVHVPTWDSAHADGLWTDFCGKDRWLGTAEGLGERIAGASDDRLWKFRSDARTSLVEYARGRLSRQLAAAGASAAQVEEAAQLFDGNVLTLGFARRFASYKRPNLLLHDPDRLLGILADARRPVQLIIAGKAHPADLAGQELIRRWIQFIRRPDVRRHAIFLSDYDMHLTEHLVQGVDVWLNTPRRPWEACGTSGMKVLVNGGINLSELDGWWAEAYTRQVGWPLGDGREHDGDPDWDAAEAAALYDLIEHEIVPAFYDRDEDGIPRAWVARMRESMARLTPRFSTNRVVREYTEQHYLPAAANYRERAAERGARGVELVRWRDSVRQRWPGLRFGDLRVESGAAQHVFEVSVYLGDLDPEAVRVELYADALGDADAVRQDMLRARPLVGAANAYVFRALVPAGRPAGDYTARLIPHHAGAAVPLEAAQILWQK
jgi:glycogen phosphorylase